MGIDPNSLYHRDDTPAFHTGPLAFPCNKSYFAIAQMGADYISYAYASAVALGGAIGYVKAGSIPSLGAGLLFGSVLGYGAYQLSENPNNYYLTLGTSTVLGGMMGMRFLNSGKFMP